MGEFRKLPSGLLVPETEFLQDEEGKYKPTIHEQRDIALTLASAVKDSGIPIDKVVGISRGGLPIMDCFTRVLNIRNTDVLAMEVYEPNPNADEPGQPPEIPRDEPYIYNLPEFDEQNIDGQGVLFVEDLTDSGKTGRFVRAEWPRALMVAIYIKESEELALDYVDLYGLNTGGRDIWIDQPGEVEQELGFSPIRVLDSIEWAVNGRPKLKGLMSERAKLLERPELLDRLGLTNPHQPAVSQ